MSYDHRDLTRTVRTKIDPQEYCADCGGVGCKFCRDTGTGCWVWTGAVDSSGYSSMKLKGTVHIAFRWVYTRLVGPIPEGMDLDHSCCHTRRCVNPDHLEPVTRSENSIRANRRRWHGDV
jgi:hypothetical protein